MPLLAQIRVERPGFTLDADLQVSPGEVLVVLGPNGSGKSTMLNALAGLQPLSSGRITLGEDVWDDPGQPAFRDTTRRRIGLVFQDYRLFPHLSVLDNVAFPDTVRGVRRHVARDRARPWLDRVGLAVFADRRPAELSGGQAQRTALARALASEPRVLLLDEPLAALDASTRLEIRSELRRHLTDFAGPTIVVTHDPLDALVLGDRILVLEHGRVTQQGPPAEVVRRPMTNYVATLMGLNLYSGELIDPTTHEVTLDGGGKLRATAPGEADVPAGEPDRAQPDRLDAGARVLVAVPPTAIALHPHRPEGSSPRNVWDGTIRGLELLTDRIRVEVDGYPSALVDITPAAMVELGLTVGHQVWLSAKASEASLYPDPGRATPVREPRTPDLR
jgi:molybdate transport system ATP-binding protein